MAEQGGDPSGLNTTEIKALRAIAKDIEARTKTKYQLEIKRIGDHKARVVYSFHEHSPFTIKMLEAKYAELDGIYLTKKAIEDKIKELHNRSLAYKILVDCPFCHTKPKKPDSKSEEKFVCDKCNHIISKQKDDKYYESIWYGINASIHLAEIYRRGSGRFAETQKVGDIIFHN
jgi:hypothetical protein